MEEIARLLTKYKNKGVLIDSNLLLVYCIGSYDSDRIPRFKRTASFSIDDFELLAQLVAFFDRVVTTPNILTEVNSFSNQLAEDIKVRYYPRFAEQIRILDEHYLASSEVSETPSFGKLGLTDSGIASIVQGKYLVLTDDLKLVVHLQSIGVDAINFNHVRALGWS
ncbi:MAG: PIN domain-containing protein [Pyrinomonadaceae bacterium]